jgi:hypothetical protein
VVLPAFVHLAENLRQPECYEELDDGSGRVELAAEGEELW